MQPLPLLSLRILVVDDYRDVADSLVMALRLHGHQATAVYTGADALTAAAADKPDVVLLDLAMPHTSGYIVVRQMKANPALKDVPVIMVTGNDAEMERLLALGAGCDAFFPKPLDWPRFKEVLGKMTRRAA
jgi:DNA-binding response OmpR family regulator